MSIVNIHSLGPVHTMPKSRGEASLLWTKLCREEKPLGLKSILKQSIVKKSLASRRKFGSTQTLLERPNSWRHNFLKVLPRLFWRRRPLNFGL